MRQNWLACLFLFLFVLQTTALLACASYSVYYITIFVSHHLKIQSLEHHRLLPDLVLCFNIVCGFSSITYYEYYICPSIKHRSHVWSGFFFHVPVLTIYNTSRDHCPLSTHIAEYCIESDTSDWKLLPRSGNKVRAVDGMYHMTHRLFALLDAATNLSWDLFIVIVWLVRLN